jgi:lysozyme
MLSQLFTALSRLKSPKPSQTESSKPSASSVLPHRRLQESLNNSFLTQATEQIKVDEGCVLHAYKDTLSYLTIGYGRLIDKRKGGGISQDEAEYLLENDIDRKLAELRDRLPWFDKLDDPRKGVLLNMAFQLGIAGLLNFKNTLAEINEGNYERAAANMLKSKWAQQTPNRAKRMAKQMETGQWVFGDQ